MQGHTHTHTHKHAHTHTQLVEKAEMEKMLNVQGAALDSLCAEKGFKVQGSDVAIPPGLCLIQF